MSKKVKKRKNKKFKKFFKRVKKIFKKPHKSRGRILHKKFRAKRIRAKKFVKHIVHRHVAAPINQQKIDYLVRKGREQSFVTEEEILHTIPEIEDHINELEDLIGRLAIGGVEIRKAPERLAVFKPVERPAKKPSAACFALANFSPVILPDRSTTTAMAEPAVGGGLIPSSQKKTTFP